MNVEASALDGGRVEENQRRVDDGPGVGEGGVENVGARAHNRVELADRRQHVLRPRRGKHAGREVRRAHGRLDLGWPRDPRQVGERSRLGEGERHPGSGARDLARHHVRAERSRSQEHDLTLGQMSAEAAGDIFMSRRRRRDDDHVGAGHRFDEIRGDRSEHGLGGRPLGHQRDAAGPTHRLQRRGIAPPQTHGVSREREVGGHGVTAVAAAEDCDLHLITPA